MATPADPDPALPRGADPMGAPSRVDGRRRAPGPEWELTRRALRRGPGVVQFGLDPESGVVLTGLSEAETAWLVSLRPATGRAGHGPMASPARTWGLDPDRVRVLVDLLRAHTLVRDLPGTPGARPENRVSVLGEGPLARRVRGQLRLVGGVRVDDGRTELPRLAVLVVRGAVGGHDARSWAASGVPHLPVVVGDHGAGVGPLVVPPAGPCLHCLDLTRQDHDPLWPVLVDQVAGLRHLGAPVAADTCLGAAVCAVVGSIVRTHVAGDPVPAGLAWSVDLSSPQVLARRWRTHPRCPHHRATPTGPAGGVA